LLPQAETGGAYPANCQYFGGTVLILAAQIISFGIVLPSLIGFASSPFSKMLEDGSGNRAGSC